MYDMVGYIIYSLLIMIGGLFIFLPGERLIDKERLKPTQEYSKVLKNKRILGVVTIIFGIILILLKLWGK